MYGNATIDAHMSEFSCQIVTDRPRSAVMRPFRSQQFHSLLFAISRKVFLILLLFFSSTANDSNPIHLLRNFHGSSLLSRSDPFLNFLLFLLEILAGSE